MLTFLAWGMIIVFLALVMTKKMHPFTALVMVPVVFGLIGALMGLYTAATAEFYEIPAASVTIWDQVKVLGEWSAGGLKATSNTAFMLLFAILFFAIMLNVGLFDPVTKTIIKIAKGDPFKILIGTGIVAAAVSLNGDGTTTTLICCTAFIPIYKKLNMRLMNLAVIVILMNTIMNLLPWGGPTARVISVLDLDATEILINLVPGMILSIIYMLGVSAFLGMQERKRVGVKHLNEKEVDALIAPASEEEAALKRPKLAWFNAILMIGTIVVLVLDWFPAVFLFLVSTVVALLVNYKTPKEQMARISDNAADALSVVILVIGAGLFSGIFTKSGMSTAIAESMITIIPESLGRFWGQITAIVSAPGTFFLSNDAFYYGVLPAFAEAGVEYGFTAMQIGTASLLGQAFHLLSPLVAFIYLLLNLTEQDMGEWQRESAKWALGIFIIFIITAGITGAVPFII